MSATRRLLLLGLSVVIVAALFFFVQLGSDDESDDAEAKPTPTASASADAEVDPEVAAIFDKARAYEADQEAVKVTADAPADTAGTAETLTFSFTGDDAQSTISSQGITVELLRVGGVDYIRAPEQFWQASQSAAAAAAQLAGKWVIISTAGTDVAAYTQYVDRDTMLQGFLSPAAGMQVGGPSDDLGVATETVTVGSTAEDSAVLHFDASTGAPIAFRSPSGNFAFDFSDASSPAKPADADIVDASSLIQ